MCTRFTISVVLPTYNCRSLLMPHLRSMEAWLDLADEVIVVDSRSTDGTLELIRAELRHPRLRIIERDRGLYQSWNEGIAATTGDWVYVSTAGDLITREQLLHLRAAGEALAFSGMEAGEMDVAFVTGGDAATAAMARVALRFDLPAPVRTEPATPMAPGSDPARPPKLR